MIDDKPKALKIDDIAAAAGVSKATVSRYLNGRKELLSEKTWARIAQVVETTNYRPSDIASNLKKKNRNIVGVLISDISSPFSSALIIGITKYLDERGYSVIIADSANDPEKETENIRSLRSRGICGLLVNTASYDNPYLIHVAREGVPVVLMDRDVQGYPFDLVTSDHAAGMHTLVEYLYAQGYTHLALFTQPWEHNSVRIARREAFLQSAAKLCPFRPDVYVIGKEPGQSVQTQLEQLLHNLRPGEVPAIVGINSITTVCAAQAIAACGLSMPEQIGLCGPEDWDWQNELNWPCMIHPNVTTIKIHSTELGSQSAAVLLNRLQNSALPQQTRIISCELVPRDSACRQNADKFSGILP